MKVLRVLCLIVGGFLVLDTLIVCFLSNYNLGVILPAVLGLPLLLLGLTDTGVSAIWITASATWMLSGLICILRYIAWRKRLAG